MSCDSLENRNYEWQERCLDVWEKAHYHGLVEAVTGAGKTHLAIEAVKRFSKAAGRLRVFVIVPQISLAQQWHRSFISEGWNADDLSIHSSKHVPRIDAAVQIYVVNTARYTLARALVEAQKAGESTFLIADEFHHYTSKENSKVFDFISALNFNPEKYASIGLSATASDRSLELLIESIGPRIFKYSFEDGLRDSVISPFNLYHVGLNLSSKEWDKYNSLTLKMSSILNLLSRFKLFFHDIKKFRRAVLKNGNLKEKQLFMKYEILLFKRRGIIADMEVRVPAAFNLLLLLPEKAKIIVFTEHIKQCEALCSMIHENSCLTFAKYHSKMANDSRKNELDLFRLGEKRILVCCKALDEGLDIPKADIGIFLSNTDSNRQRIQRIGRLLRRSEGKDYADLYYFYAKDTVESTCMITGTPSTGLLYSGVTFENPEFDYYFNLLLGRMKHRPNKNEWFILEQVAKKASIRRDYCRLPEVLLDKISKSDSNSDRDYLTVCYEISRNFIYPQVQDNW